MVGAKPEGATTFSKMVELTERLGVIWDSGQHPGDEAAGKSGSMSAG